MLSRVLLVVAGVFGGLWLQPTSVGLNAEWLPWLALLTLALATFAAPRPVGGDDRARTEESYRHWLDAWLRLRLAQDHERPAAQRALSAAGNAVLLAAPDRVIKSMQAATNDDLAPAAVARLVLDMRRSLRRAGLSVRSEDLEGLLEPRRRVTAEPQSVAPTTAVAASFLV
jgi:hypothetical protein